MKLHSLLLLALAASGSAFSQTPAPAPQVNNAPQDQIVNGALNPSVAAQIEEVAPANETRAQLIARLRRHHDLPMELAKARPSVPKNLYRFIANDQAAIQLGKALFWDTQVGSDARTACATCHFAAGADNRTRFTLSGGVQSAALTANDFPRLTGDVVGSLGVPNKSFRGIVTGQAEEIAGPPVGTPTGTGHSRQVTGRNSPSVINAIFNHRNFWDGRANNSFNGVNPFGARDTNAMVWHYDAQSRTLFQKRVNIENASLASQAVGPVVSSVEMSYAGREWKHLGRKLLSLKPLGLQEVDKKDSVLGPLASENKHKKGLETTYEALIKRAFSPVFWAAPDRVDGYRQIELNFSLYFGLAVMMYESTLVSDDTRFDEWLDGDNARMTTAELKGLDTFLNKGKCTTCHHGPLLTAASTVRLANRLVPERQAAEFMRTAGQPAVFYDNGFYNVGVRPWREDLGVGGNDPFGQPLSLSAQVASWLNGRFVWDSFKIEPDVFLNPNLATNTATLAGYTFTNSIAALASVPVSTAGNFKTAGLRNVSLTGPYFHNGSKLTLRQVVDFYNRGADFSEENKAFLDLDIEPLGLKEEEKVNLVAFLLTLTDERVKFRQAPFDGPELVVPHDSGRPTPAGTDPEDDRNVIYLEAVGKDGADKAFRPYLAVNHQTRGVDDDALALAAEDEEAAERAARRGNVLGAHERQNLFPPKAGINRPGESLFIRRLAR